MPRHSFSIKTMETQGPITWRISSRAEISDRLLKQILWKPNCRLHGEGFSPGGNSARAENGPRACALTVFSHLNFLTEICVLHPGWNWACNHNNISARWAERNFSPGWNSPCNRAPSLVIYLWWKLTIATLFDTKFFASPQTRTRTFFSDWN